MSIEKTEKPIYEKNFTYSFSIILFVIIIAITIWIYLFNFYTIREIASLNDDISSMNKAILDIKKDPKIQIFELLESNKANIAMLDKKSNVVPYIYEIKRISSVYGIEFSWFDYWAWAIKTSVNIPWDDVWVKLAYQKTSEFIEKYRKSDKEAIFNLPFINDIEWQSNIKFAVNFNIKSLK